MQSGTVFNVWKDGEIHPTAVLAISGLGFDSLSNLANWMALFGHYQSVADCEGCLSSPVPLACSTLPALLRFVTAVYFNLSLNSPVCIFKTLKSN